MFKLEFSTDNAAFGYGEQTIETVRILRRIVTQLEQGRDSGKVMDINGNAIGSWSVEYAEAEAHHE